MSARLNECESTAIAAPPPLGEISGLNGIRSSDPNDRIQKVLYFILTVLGFSFWFFMAVPFASHRETYSWLAWARIQTFAQQFSFGLSSTYRPLAEPVTWLCFRVLDPRIFPTSIVRQTLFQVFIYAMFVLAWWLIYSVAPQRRLFAMVSFVVGSVFFSGYVHLFHIYGMMYVPVVLMLGALLHFQATGEFQKREVWFASLAVLLMFWHPFATALFVGFYSGFCLDTFWQRDKLQRAQAIGLWLLGILAIAATLFVFQREHMPLNAKLFGFLVSYQTNEVNRVASFVAFVLTQLVVWSMKLSPKVKFAAFLCVAILSVALLFESVPLLFLWFGAVLIKLFRLRSWSLFFLMLTAALLPFGGGIGTPIYVLFAIIVAVYATPLGWSEGEEALSFLKPQYVVGISLVMASVILMVRFGMRVPVVTRVASPLLTERERTYQLENVLAWFHNSDYCGYEIAFAKNAGSPSESVENVITRQNRPPAALVDVRYFWDNVLQCHNVRGPRDQSGTVVVTFGESSLAGASPIYDVPGRYAGDAIVWVSNAKK
jgi:hypothetical protein